MSHYLRAATVWGGVCFILLYSTLPADATLWIQLYQKYDFSFVEFINHFIIQALPALLPFVCFLLLGKMSCNHKVITLILPFTAWFTGKFILLWGSYFIALKSGNILPYTESFLNIAKRMITPEWLMEILAFVLTIVACSYAFWRESTFLVNKSANSK